MLVSLQQEARYFTSVARLMNGQSKNTRRKPRTKVEKAGKFIYLRFLIVDDTFIYFCFAASINICLVVFVIKAVLFLELVGVVIVHWFGLLQHGVLPCSCSS